MFQYSVYDSDRSTLFKKKISTGFIYTMGVNEGQLKEMGYEQNLKIIEMAMKRIFGASESLYVTDTYQFDDYSKYVSTLFNVSQIPEHNAFRGFFQCYKIRLWYIWKRGVNIVAGEKAEVV